MNQLTQAPSWSVTRGAHHHGQASARHSSQEERSRVKPLVLKTPSNAGSGKGLDHGLSNERHQALICFIWTPPQRAGSQVWSPARIPGHLYRWRRIPHELPWRCSFRGSNQSFVHESCNVEMRHLDLAQSGVVTSYANPNLLIRLR